MKRVELLAPAKNFKSIKAGIAVADAFYLGLEILNMRVRADNFKVDDLAGVVKFCHDRDTRVYVTTNTIIYDRELEVLADLLAQVHAAGTDAVIVHDLATIQLARDLGLPFHASTQLSISNRLAARFFEKLGAERLILARELSLDQIREVKTHLNTAGVECFVHGAQCTSISGRCYFSADVCGSADYSANRGACIQPCRRKFRVIDEENNEFLYDGQMFLNAKDLCMIAHVPALVAAGIDAFKIEGRMRDPFYVEVVTRCYREALEAHYAGTFSREKVDQWLEELARVYNRGFSTGFYFTRPTETEIEHEVRGNVSEYARHEVGRVQDYFTKAGAAKVILTRGRLKVGDEVIIEGPHSDTYFRQTVKSIHLKNKRVVKTPRASSGNNVLIGLLVDQPVKKNDRVYLFQKRRH